MNTEEQRELAAAAQRSSIPTLMAFRDGVLVFNQPGALPPAALATEARALDTVERRLGALGTDTVDEDRLGFEKLTARAACSGSVVNT